MTRPIRTARNPVKGDNGNTCRDLRRLGYSPFSMLGVPIGEHLICNSCEFQLNCLANQKEVPFVQQREQNEPY